MSRVFKILMTLIMMIIIMIGITMMAQGYLLGDDEESRDEPVWVPAAPTASR